MLKIKKVGGEGRRTVLLHGFGSESQSWVANTPALLKGCEVWALDLPGHGQSNRVIPAAGIAGLAEQLTAAVFVDDSPVDLLGHSLGGALAMALAVKEPARVRSLALVAPLGLGGALKTAFLSEFSELATEQDTHSALLSLVHKPQFISPVFAPLVLAQLERPGVRSALKSIADTILGSQNELKDMVTEVSQSDLSRLVIWGEQDRINPLLETAAESFGGNWHCFDRCGHLPHIECRVPTNELLADFLHRD